MSISLWSSQSTPSGNNMWYSITYGNGLFVAVAGTGTANRIMTSPDGITWSSPNCPDNNSTWNSVTYGNNLFVAVASAGSPQVMTSPDGINWTLSSVQTNNSNWNSVTYGDGLFVAVAGTGNANRIMTSSNGIDWTLRNVNTSIWNSVTYGDGLFVAVSSSGVAMTSPNGINWTLSNVNNTSVWNSVTYGNGLYVAVAPFGIKNVMISQNGINWNLQKVGTNQQWRSITYGDGLFVAVSSNGTSKVMTSPNGIDWRLLTSENQLWYSVCYGNNLFVAVSINTFDNKVMTATTLSPTTGPLYIPEQEYNLIPYTITIDNPLSNSPGYWSYTSSDTDVATVSGNSLTIKNIGHSLITGIQEATTSYACGIVTTTLVVSQISTTPTITNFSIPTKIYGDSPFEIVQPDSDSTGSFSYTSSKLSVATIVENIITIRGVGYSEIIATQEATDNYTSGTIQTTLLVTNSSVDNPVIINNGNNLNYFMNTTSVYANLTDSVEINDDLVALNYKKLDTNSSSIIITKNVQNIT